MTVKTPQEQEIDTAYHEAGHAVMGCLLERYPEYVSIIPDGKGMVGETQFAAEVPVYAKRHLDDSPAKRQYARQRVLGELAGTITHDIKEPGRKHDPADENDEKWTRELIIELVSWEDEPKYFEKSRDEAAALLKANWSWVVTVAKALCRQKKLLLPEILALRRRDGVTP